MTDELSKWLIYTPLLITAPIWLPPAVIIFLALELEKLCNNYNI